MDGPVKTSYIIGKYLLYKSNSQENGEIQHKERGEGAAGRKKGGKGFSSGNTVWRKTFAETSEALNALQVKFDRGEGKKGGQF